MSRKLRNPNDGASQVNTFRIAEINWDFWVTCREVTVSSQANAGLFLSGIECGWGGVNSELQWPAKEGRAGAS